MDVDTTTALIRAEFRLKPDEKALWKTLEESYYQNGVFVPSDEARDVISTNFSKLFELVIYAVNPKNSKETQIKKHKELEELFPFHIIPAERLLGEDGTQNSSLSSLISEFFEMNEEELDPNVAEKVKELRAIVEKANKNVQKQSDSILSSLVNDSVGFGYPNGEELQLGVTTQLSIDDQIKNQTQLSYTAGTSNECLPSTYNGLGYKNLIKMEFLLAAFAKKVEKCGNACIPLLFIEEPEAYQREHGTDDEHHNANDSGHLVVVLLLCQAEQPCDQQIHLFCTGGSQRLILGDINVLREQVDDVEVVDVAHKVRYQRRPLHTEQIGQLDVDEALPRRCTVDGGGLQHIGGNIHQHTGGNEHLVGHAHPDVDEDDHELCPVLVGQEGNVVHVLPQQTDGL